MLRIVFVFLIGQCAAVIYNLNESEYERMPALFALDPFARCVGERGGLYCVLDASLRARGRSELMRIIQEYSEHTIKHFNHTQIHRGICVTRTCQGFIHGRKLNETEDLEATLEACLNHSIWRDYKLEATIDKIQYCQREGENDELDASDFVVAAIYLLLIVCNVAGSLYDVFICEKDGKGKDMNFDYS